MESNTTIGRVDTDTFTTDDEPVEEDVRILAMSYLMYKIGELFSDVPLSLIAGLFKVSIMIDPV